MSNYIDRNRVINIIDNNKDKSYEEIINLIKDLDGEKVKPIVKAKWVYDHTESKGGDFAILRCTNCGYKAYAQSISIKEGRYCPICGALMSFS